MILLAGFISLASGFLDVRTLFYGHLIILFTIHCVPYLLQGVRFHILPLQSVEGSLGFLCKILLRVRVVLRLMPSYFDLRFLCPTNRSPTTQIATTNSHNFALG